MKTSAIYEILNVVTNDRYIGRSVDIEGRLFGKKLLRDKNPMYGKKHSEATKRKISETKRCRRKECEENVRNESSECK